MLIDRGLEEIEISGRNRLPIEIGLGTFETGGANVTPAFGMIEQVPDRFRQRARIALGNHNASQEELEKIKALIEQIEDQNKEDQ